MDNWVGVCVCVFWFELTIYKLSIFVQLLYNYYNLEKSCFVQLISKLVVLQMNVLYLQICLTIVSFRKSCKDASLIVPPMLPPIWHNSER